MRGDTLLWVLAVALYGVGDTVTTLINLHDGYVELNPLVNEYSIIPLKIFIILTLFLIYRGMRSTVLPAILVVLGSICVLNNVLVNLLT